MTRESAALRITLVADARSPIAQGWFEAVVAAGYSIQVLSTYPVRALRVPGSLVVLPTLPVAVSRHHSPSEPEGKGLPSRHQRGWRRGVTPSSRPRRSEVDQLRSMAYREARLAGEMLFRQAVGRAVRSALDDFQPDIVHALRIPYEAILVAPVMRSRAEPFVVSTWGNDLTLWAAKSWVYRRLTKSVLRQTDRLHSDCDRDVVLARLLGYDGPSVVAPGSGGIDVERLLPLSSPQRARDLLGAPDHAPIIFNPRSSRPYVRNDVFFAALPAVMRRFPAAIAVTVGMERSNFVDDAAALGLANKVRFLPAQDATGMGDLFRAATLTVSPSTHDGTPNTLLEAMAYGSFPIVGDLDSLREWIEPGVNGLVVDPNEPAALCGAMIEGLSNASLRDRAAMRNRAIIDERASRDATRPAIERLYRVSRRRSLLERNRDQA